MIQNNKKFILKTIIILFLLTLGANEGEENSKLNEFIFKTYLERGESDTYIYARGSLGGHYRDVSLSFGPNGINIITPSSEIGNESYSESETTGFNVLEIINRIVNNPEFVINYDQYEHFDFTGIPFEVSKFNLNLDTKMDQSGALVSDLSFQLEVNYYEELYKVRTSDFTNFSIVTNEHTENEIDSRIKKIIASNLSRVVKSPEFIDEFSRLVNDYVELSEVSIELQNILGR